MSASKRSGSALSLSSNELLDQQLNELIDASGTPAPPTDEERNASAGRPAGTQDEDVEGESENVAVMVRCRPLGPVGSGPGGRAQGEELAVKADEANRCVEAADRRFFYDQVFGPDCDNERVYMRSARRLVDSAFRGYNCAIFLYGQTGTGKTHTHSALTLAAFEHLFSLIQDSSKGMRFLIRASYYELYNEEIRDLLVASPPASKSGGRARSARKPLELSESKERGVYVKNLTCFLVNNLSELKKLKQVGDRRRTTSSTKMNEHSSRSHSIFSITIETISTEAAATATAATAEEAPPRRRAVRPKTGAEQRQPSVRVGHLNLIDLAGSERQSKSGASGLALKEASRINLSLTCLSLVIRALTDKTAAAGHIPYRNSKLTRLLSSSLGGNSKTALIACVSVARSNLDETLNTLRFASRTKQIKNRAVINEDPKDALLRKYRKQLEELRMKLNERQQMAGAGREPLAQLEAANDRVGNSEAADLIGNATDNQDDEQARLKNQLELLKAKIMFGGENLLDKLELHERLLAASQAELEERKRDELKLRERLLSKKQTIEQVVQSRGSLEGQLEYLEAKLDRAIELYRSSKLELRDLASEHEQLREQLLQTIKATSKEIKYVDCINDDFIPHEQLDLINAYAQYDDESDEWQIKYIALSGNNMARTRRLVGPAQQPPMDPASELGAGQRVTVRRDRQMSAGMTSGRRKKSTESTGNRPDPYLRLAS